MKNMKTAMIAGAFVAAFAGAWIFRYEPIRVGLVWDRWMHRACTVDWDSNIHCSRE
jgi:hypothetical protein